MWIDLESEQHIKPKMMEVRASPTKIRKNERLAGNRYSGPVV